jgi:hypothetical protein
VAPPPVDDLPVPVDPTLLVDDPPVPPPDPDVALVDVALVEGPGPPPVVGGRPVPAFSRPAAPPE